MRKSDKGPISPETFSLVQEIARIGSWEWDIASDVLRASPELVTLFGLPASAFRIEDWLAAIHPDDIAATREA